MERFKNKYSIGSPRAPNWDYTSTGNYFITINTRNRHCAFGEITDGVMKLSTNGEWANEYWIAITDHFKNVQLDEFVIMPDHVHGILHLDSIVETLHATSLQQSDIHATSLLNGNESISQSMSRISPKKGSLGAVIRSYKSACTKKFKELDAESWYGWQPLYYDHIIRNNNELLSIRKYIRNNA